MSFRHGIAVAPNDKVVAIKCGNTTPPFRGIISLSAYTSLSAFDGTGGNQIQSLSGAQTLSSLRVLELEMPRRFYNTFLPLMATAASWPLSAHRFIRDNTVTLRLDRDFPAIQGLFALTHQISADWNGSLMTFSTANSAATLSTCFVQIATASDVEMVSIKGLGPIDDDLRVRLSTRAGDITASDTRWNMGWYQGSQQVWFPETLTGTRNTGGESFLPVNYRQINIPQLSLPFWRGYFVEEGTSIHVDMMDGWGEEGTIRPCMVTTLYDNGVNVDSALYPPVTGVFVSEGSNPASPEPPYSTVHEYGPHFVNYYPVGSTIVPPKINLAPLTSVIYTREGDDLNIQWNESPNPINGTDSLAVVEYKGPSDPWWVTVEEFFPYYTGNHTFEIPTQPLTGPIDVRVKVKKGNYYTRNNPLTSIAPPLFLDGGWDGDWNLFSPNFEDGGWDGDWNLFSSGT